jgi:hypothetical protein
MSIIYTGKTQNQLKFFWGGAIVIESVRATRLSTSTLLGALSDSTELVEVLSKGSSKYGPLLIRENRTKEIWCYQE